MLLLFDLSVSDEEKKLYNNLELVPTRGHRRVKDCRGQHAEGLPRVGLEHSINLCIQLGTILGDV